MLISEGSDPGTDTDRVLALAQFYVELGRRLSGRMASPKYWRR